MRPVLRAHLVVAVRLPEVRQRDREEAAALRRYYLTQRPPQIGAYPKGAKKVVALGERRRVDGCARSVWGWVEFEEPLTPKQVDDYELIEEE